MDLLKTVLKKTQNTLEDRFDCSNISEISLCGYETALDQSNSMYFSMSENDGDKTTTFDESLVSESTLKCSDNSNATTTESPSITLIASTPTKKTNMTFETVMEEENITEASPHLNLPVINFDTSDSDNSVAVNPFTCGSQKKKDVAEASPCLKVPFIVLNTIDNDKKILVNPFTCGELQEKENEARISSHLKVPVAILCNTIDNDNSIPVNPFTSGKSQEKENVAGVSLHLKVPAILCDTSDSDKNIALNPITCNETQKLVSNLKKPTTLISKIATRSYLYNPIQRKSLDKLSPMFANRRSVAITKPIQKVSKAKVTFSCEWCKKSFDINKALTNHLLEYCQKIPCNERKKLSNPALEPNTDQKRKSVFVMPTARKTYATATATKRPRMTFNMTGIIKTPTKTLFCTLCALKFQDVSSYAKHIITHKKSSIPE